MSDVSLNESTEQPAVAEATTTEPVGLSSQLSEDLRSNPSLSDFKDVNSLAKSYISAQQMLGSSIRIPGEDASEEVKQEFFNKLSSIPGVTRLPDSGNKEAMDAFYNSLGRPETIEGYELHAPEGVPVDEHSRDEFLKKAHELGLTKAQVNELAKYELEKHAQQQEQLISARDKAAEVLREQWGHEYNNRLAGAKAVVKVYSEKYPDAMREVLEGPMANNPAIISMMSELAKTLNESGHAGATSNVRYGMSSEEARAQLAEINGNRAHAYWDPDNPAHSAAVEKVTKLNRIAFPE